jgi:hypothetical protein
LSELSYASVLLPGEGRGGRNAVVVAVSKRQAKLMEFRRVSSRALGFRVLHKRESCERHLVALHGPTSDTGDASAGRQFKATLSSADSWLRARGGGLLFGDFNRVPCAEWHASRAPLDSADRALRTLTRWSCECCRRVGDPSASDANTIAGGDGGIGSDSGWTRYATHASVLGAATSRIDLAVTIGGGAVWTEQANILPISGGTRSEGLAVSDHTLNVYSLPLETSRSSRTQRPRAPQLPRGSAAAAAVAECLHEGAPLFAAAVSAARAVGRPATDACVDLVNRASLRAAWR